ncbi:hypothetical protein GF380_06160 [Candidatus Uhrbacteria bacterium]|nr:hypothetical protein [Candidatus Uhrbacteria bacterium]MBD3284558.1 hypothetical protein [Candidatus Uhrbacteria bacterium]
MIYLTIGIIVTLLIAAGLFYAFSDLLSELDGNFMYVILGAVVLLMGAAIYLGFAVPSLANIQVFESEKPSAVTQDNMEGLELILEEPLDRNESF